MRISDWSSDVCSSDLSSDEPRAATIANASRKPGKASKISLKAVRMRSIHPPAYPATAPSSVPIDRDSNTTDSATSSETRAPHISRERIQRPNWSLPSGYFRDRTSVVEGKSGLVRVDLGGRRIMKTTKKKKK